MPESLEMLSNPLVSSFSRSRLRVPKFAFQRSSGLDVASLGLTLDFHRYPHSSRSPHTQVLFSLPILKSRVGRIDFSVAQQIHYLEHLLCWIGGDQTPVYQRPRKWVKEVQTGQWEDSGRKCRHPLPSLWKRCVPWGAGACVSQPKGSVL